MSEIICELTSDFRGKYPDVPFAEGVDVEAFKSETNPFFVTLPISKVGVTSRNGRTFDRAAVERIVNQVNDKKPEGGLGHLTPSERGSRYEMPKVRWLGAMIDTDGTAWGKAYIPEYASDVREFFKTAKMANARVGTSIYGKEGEAGLADMTLEQIDLGHPDRLGVLEVGAIPKITAELEDQNTEAIMPEKEVIAELIAAKDATIAELQSKVSEAAATVAELTKKAEIADGLIAELGSEKPVEKVQKLISVVAELEAKQHKTAIEGVVAELVTLEDMRPIIKGQLGDVKALTVDAAKEKIVALLNDEGNKKVAKALALLVSGGRAIVTELKTGNELKEPTAADVAKARAEWGI